MSARKQAVAHATAVGGLAGVFVYQGLVPKVWKVDSSEVAIWEGFGLPESLARKAVRVVGLGEAGFGLVTVARSRQRWPFVIAMAAMPSLFSVVAKADRPMLTRAFNPGSLGIAVVALAGVALATR